MIKLNTVITNKSLQWADEALMFCASHGRNGGEFTVSRWANGRMMAEAVGSRCNQAISAELLESLKASDWRIQAHHCDMN